MIYCDYCELEQPSIEIVQQAQFLVHGKNIEIQQKTAICTICKNRVYDELLEDDTMKLISKTYSELYGSKA